MGVARRVATAITRPINAWTKPSANLLSIAIAVLSFFPTTPLMVYRSEKVNGTLKSKTLRDKRCSILLHDVPWISAIRS